MPLFNFKCKDCSFKKEHFLLNAGEQPLCPKCKSNNYFRTLGRVRMDVEYSNAQDHMENKIQPMIDETYAQIGREAMFEDTSTLENIYGTDKVKRTFYENDGWGEPEGD